MGARKAATAGIILLRNNGILPLHSNSIKSLAIMGSAANVKDSSIAGSGSAYAGGGSSHVVSPNVVTPLAGIRERAATAGVKVRHYSGNHIYTAQQEAAQVDVVVVVGATVTAEGWDRRNLSLDDETNALIDGVCNMKPTIAVGDIGCSAHTLARPRICGCKRLPCWRTNRQCLGITVVRGCRTKRSASYHIPCNGGRHCDSQRGSWRPLFRAHVHLI